MPAAFSTFSSSFEAGQMWKTPLYQQARQAETSSALWRAKCASAQEAPPPLYQEARQADTASASWRAKYSSAQEVPPAWQAPEFSQSLVDRRNVEQLWQMRLAAAREETTRLLLQVLTSLDGRKPPPLRLPPGLSADFKSRDFFVASTTTPLSSMPSSSAPSCIEPPAIGELCFPPGLSVDFKLRDLSVASTDTPFSSIPNSSTPSCLELPAIGEARNWSAWGSSNSLTGGRAGQESQGRAPHLESGFLFEDADTDASMDMTSAVQQQPSAITSYMVRNIPRAYNQETLLEDWAPDGSFDFLYLPRNNGGNICLGYAFINFVSEEKANAFLAVWQGAAMPRHESPKRIQFHPADVQGFEASVQQYKTKLEAARMKRARLARPFIGRAGFDIDSAED